MRILLLGLVLVLACGDDDAPPDAGLDGGADAAVDGGSDAPPDIGVDTSAPPVDLPAPVLRHPPSGATTGSVHAPEAARPRLVWEPVPDATTHQVQLEADCVAPFAACAFPTPELDLRTMGEPLGDAIAFRPESDVPVATEVPVGTRYAWRVRGCNDDGCGDWSAVRYLDIGRDANDFDGDGWPDLAVAAQGEVYVFTGDGTGAVETPPSVLPAVDDGGMGIGDLFGDSLASGDLDGDGFADLVVGDTLGEGATNDIGAVFVYYGSAEGLAADPTHTMVSPTGQSLGFFGVALAIGDLDGDGFRELAVGGTQLARPMAGEGNVILYPNPTGRFDDPTPVTIDSPGDQTGSEHGGALTADADLNGDGLLDLVVSAPLFDTPFPDAGAVYVYFGDPEGVDGVVGVTLEGPDVPLRLGLGNALGTGDVNGDARPDLLVGADQSRELVGGIGEAWLFGGSPDGPMLPPMVFNDPGVGGGGRFGATVALVDGLAVVGAPDRDGGAVFVFEATPRALDDEEAGANAFGASLTRLDLNADGFEDVVVGAPEAGEGGAVHVFLGGATGLPSTPDRTLREAEGSAPRFGRRLTTR